MQIERYRIRHPVYFRPFFSPRVFRGDLNRVFSDLLDETVGKDSGGFSPAFDLLDTKDSIKVNLELPGVKKEDVEISLKGDLLTIKGEKREEKEEKGENRYYVERSYGSFSRTMTLPSNVQADQVKAAFANGILEITLPKAEDEKAREVQVKVD